MFEIHQKTLFHGWVNTCLNSKGQLVQFNTLKEAKENLQNAKIKEGFRKEELSIFDIEKQQYVNLKRNTEMPRSSKEYDIVIGRKVQNLRKSKGFSREQLAEKIDVTHQQLQKYETATNRITVSRLMMILTALEIPIPSFFEGLHDISLPSARERMQLEAIRNFLAIEDTNIQEELGKLFKTLKRNTITQTQGE